MICIHTRVSGEVLPDAYAMGVQLWEQYKARCKLRGYGIDHVRPMNLKVTAFGKGMWEFTRP